MVQTLGQNRLGGLGVLAVLLVLPECGTTVDSGDCGQAGTCGEGGSVDGGLLDAPDARLDAADAPAEGDGWGCGSMGVQCDGGCVQSDVHNCGACGHDCTKLANVTGGASCSASGVCVLGPGSCAPGWADCNGDPNDGCETDITQPAHCGSCGMACPTTSPLCSESMGDGYACSAKCSSNTTLCGQSCVDTMTSSTHCGSCTNACPGIAGGHGTCSGGACGVACDAGFTMCNGMCVGVDSAAGVFASPGSATSGCGTADAPCGTIAAALSVAAASGKTLVYMASGTYSETVVLSSSVTLQGGWSYAGGSSWQPVCSGDAAASAVIQGVEGAGFIVGGSAGVIVTGGSPTLESLTIESKSVAAAGESLYGVFAANAGSITLTDVEVHVAAGGVGQEGSQGTAAGAPPSSCPAAAGTSVNGGPGNPGGNGPGAPSATWSPTGYSPAAGGVGTAGGPGGNGSVGAQGACVSQTPTACIASHTPPCAALGPAQMVCGGVGGNGCGGYGSGPGSPGGGGGSSVAIYAWNTSVSATGQFAAGNAGDGGDGGAGGSAGMGSTGGTGSQGTLDQCVLSPCGSAMLPVSGATGSGGTTGGTGGVGGQGGGGAGGSSYCFVQGGGGQITAPASACMYGSAGTGGNVGGGSAQGQNGSAGVAFAVP